MPGTARSQNLQDFDAMSPAARAASNAANAIALFGNAATFGGSNGLIDLAHGVPWGTTSALERERLNDGPLAVGSAAEGLGSVVSGRGVIAAGKAIIPRVVAAAAPAVGARYAGIVGDAPVTRLAAARGLGALALPSAGALALASAAGRGAPAAPAAETAAQPTPAEAVSSALAQGRAAAPSTPQSALADTILRVLSRNPSISDLQTVGQLVPAATKPTITQRDAGIGNILNQSAQVFQSQVGDLANQVQQGTLTPEQGRASAAKLAIERIQRESALYGAGSARLAQVQAFTDQEQ